LIWFAKKGVEDLGTIAYVVMENWNVYLSFKGHHPHMIRDCDISKLDVWCAGRIDVDGGGVGYIIPTSGYLPNTKPRDFEVVEELLQEALVKLDLYIHLRWKKASCKIRTFQAEP